MTLQELELNMYNMWAGRPTAEAWSLYIKILHSKVDAIASYIALVDIYRGHITKHEWAAQYAKSNNKSVRTGYRALAKSLNTILDIINEGE